MHYDVQLVGQAMFWFGLLMAPFGALVAAMAYEEGEPRAFKYFLAPVIICILSAGFM